MLEEGIIKPNNSNFLLPISIDKKKIGHGDSVWIIAFLMLLQL